MTVSLLKSVRFERLDAGLLLTEGVAELMQMKIIIMSATLPNLDILTDNHCQTIRLIENREKYFNHPKFARRVVADYSLLEQKMAL